MIIISTISNDMMLRESRQSIIDDLNECSLQIEKKLQNVEAATEAQIWLVKEHINDPEYYYTLTSRLVEVNNLIVGSSVTFVPDYYPDKGKWFMPYSCIDRETGKIISMQAGNENYRYEGMEWFTIPVSTKQNYWTNPYKDEGAGEVEMVTYSVPIWDEDGKVFAVLTADVGMNQLTNSIEQIKMLDGAYPVVVSRDGTYIYHPNKSWIFNNNVYEFLNRVSNSVRDYPSLDKTNQVSEARYRGLDNKEYFMAHKAIENGWHAGVVCPYEAAFSEAKHLGWWFMILSILGIAAMLYANKRIINLNTQSLVEFSYSAMNMGQGNFTTKIPAVKTQDEIGRLHDSLVYLQNSIIDYIHELKSTTASKERFESELNIATGIQDAMLTKDFPNNEKLTSFAILHPAKEVGGDLYDMLIIDNYLYFAVGDVSGKGVPAALYMAISRSALRFMFQMNLSMDKLVYNINNAFCDGNDSGMFVTMFVGRVNLDTLEMEYCNAGHNPIIIRKPDGKADYLHAKPNIAAGLFPGFNYEKETLTLEKGSTILVYTDGVTEAENVVKDQYGEERLLNFMSSTDTTGKDLINGVKNELKHFVNHNEQNDDITALTLTFK